jgi:hypothetical protein
LIAATKGEMYTGHQGSARHAVLVLFNPTDAPVAVDPGPLIARAGGELQRRHPAGGQDVDRTGFERDRGVGPERQRAGVGRFDTGHQGSARHAVLVLFNPTDAPVAVDPGPLIARPRRWPPAGRPAGG